MGSRAIVGHLFSCCDAVYRVLGESAPRLSNDAFVVRLHDCARSFGSLALIMRSHLEGSAPAPLPSIEAVLTRAIDSDPSGTMAMYAMIAVVGPRLLVTLRDARVALSDDPQLCGLLDAAAQAVVGEMHHLAGTTSDQSAIQDPQWQISARNLVEMCELTGNAESWGLSR